MSKRHNSYRSNKAFNSIVNNNTNSRDMNNTYLNEAGLFEAMLYSNTPEAREFQNELFTKILPLIRRFGYYATPNKRIEDNINNLQGNQYSQNRRFDDTTVNSEPQYSDDSGYIRFNTPPDGSEDNISERLAYSTGFSCSGEYATLEDVATELNDLLDTNIDDVYLRKTLVDMGYLSFSWDKDRGVIYKSKDESIIIYPGKFMLLTPEIKLKLCGKVIDNIIRFVNRTKDNKQHN